MAVRSPVIVFVFSHEGSATSTRYGGFAKRLAKQPGLEKYTLKTVALENLVFTFEENGNAQVIDFVSGLDFSTVDFVYFRTWSKCRSEAVALANYLEGKGIPFMDSLVLGTGESKISTFAKLWKDHLPFPQTVYCRNQKHLLSYLIKEKLFDKIFILKDVLGSRGSNNFLVTYKTLKRTLDNYQTVQFAAQRFIPNKGDYRVGIYAGTPSLYMHRSASKDSHLNNISAGGQATLLRKKELPGGIVDMAKKAAKTLKLETAGVDVIVEKTTDKAYVLEVNQGSQIVTGAYVEQKIKLFNQALADRVSRRIHRSTKKPLTIIGRRLPASLPDLGVKDLIAKIDTGAYISTLHAENIRLETNPKGMEELVFELQHKDGFVLQGNKNKTIRTSDFTRLFVKSTIGVGEMRYCIRSKVVIAGESLEERLTLTDRSSMRYPLLIGRGLLRSHFLVNVELDEGRRNFRSSRKVAKKSERTIS